MIGRFAAKTRSIFSRSDSENTSSLETTRVNDSLEIRLNSKSVRVNISVDWRERVSPMLARTRSSLQLQAKIYLLDGSAWRINTSSSDSSVALPRSEISRRNLDSTLLRARPSILFVGPTAEDRPEDDHLLPEDDPRARRADDVTLSGRVLCVSVAHCVSVAPETAQHPPRIRARSTQEGVR